MLLLSYSLFTASFAILCTSTPDDLGISIRIHDWKTHEDRIIQYTGTPLSESFMVNASSFLSAVSSFFTEYQSYVVSDKEQKRLNELLKKEGEEGVLRVLERRPVGLNYRDYRALYQNEGGKEYTLLSSRSHDDALLTKVLKQVSKNQPLDLRSNAELLRRIRSFAQSLFLVLVYERLVGQGDVLPAYLILAGTVYTAILVLFRTRSDDIQPGKREKLAGSLLALLFILVSLQGIYLAGMLVAARPLLLVYLSLQISILKGGERIRSSVIIYFSIFAGIWELASKVMEVMSISLEISPLLTLLQEVLQEVLT